MTAPASLNLLRRQLAREQRDHDKATESLNHCLEQLGAVTKDAVEFRRGLAHRYCGMAWFSASALRKIAVDWPVGLDERELIVEMADLILGQIPPELARRFAKDLGKGARSFT